LDGVKIAVSNTSNKLAVKVTLANDDEMVMVER
jgi:hypothetical protein